MGLGQRPFADVSGASRSLKIAAGGRGIRVCAESAARGATVEL